MNGSFARMTCFPPADARPPATWLDMIVSF
jgi:hypothetical protein